MGRRGMVVVLAMLLAGACAGGETAMVDSTTTSSPDDPTTTTSTTPVSGDGEEASGDSCDGPPVWALQPMQSPPPDTCQEPEPEPELGTGDVQITLRWESDADLDLHVVEPDGAEIWYGDRGPTATGGRLDVDSNVGCEPDGSVENVFWEEGDMPLGSYTVSVVGFTVDGCGSGDYTLTVNVQGEEIVHETGTVGQDDEISYDFEV